MIRTAFPLIFKLLEIEHYMNMPIYRILNQPINQNYKNIFFI